MNLYLIVGASGFIGKKIYSNLKMGSEDVHGTYYPNLAKNSSDNMILLDLNKKDSFDAINKKYNYVIFSHGISKIEHCEQEKETTYNLNVLNTINLLKHLKNLNNEIIPVYLSTNMVYGWGKRDPVESDATFPETEYGRQKLEVEKHIFKEFDRHIILRLTRVYGVEKGDKTIFTSMMDDLLRNISVVVADKIFISPVYVEDVVGVIKSMVKNNIFGTFNLGGDYTDSIYNFAKNMAKYFNLNSELIKIADIRSKIFGGRKEIFNTVDNKKIKSAIGAIFISPKEAFKMIEKNYNIA